MADATAGPSFSFERTDSIETTTGKIRPTPANIAAASRLKCRQSTNTDANSQASTADPPML